MLALFFINEQASAQPLVQGGRLRRRSTQALDHKGELAIDPKRILLGLAATAVFSLVAGQLLSLANFTFNPVLQSVVLGFLATTIGALIARRGFVFPALGLWFVGWLLVVYLLYFIAAPTGQASFLAIAQANLLSIALSALAVAIGALVGQALAKRVLRSAPAI